jgi:hypothetical protein
MNILIACEYSGIVRDAFTKKGHNVISCDLLDSETSGQHYKGSVLDLLENNKFDLIIAFPPCTDLSNAQSGPCMQKKIETGKSAEALEFIKKIYESCDKVVIENPVSSYLNKNWLHYDQIIEPYQFGHNYRKRTCLWLKNMPFLMHTIWNEPKYLLVKTYNKTEKTAKLPNTSRKDRSRFHPLVAEAMAEQWG